MIFLLDEKRMLDFDTMRRTLCLSKSKLQRELKCINPKTTQYKNMLLYEENTFINLLEKTLLEKIYGYTKNK